jgi:hypothetical protein
MYLQTGDVLYKQVDKLPKKLKKLKGNLIHQGRDHHHLIEGKFQLHEGDEGFFIETKGMCSLTHPEHKTLMLEKGLYKKEIVQEYDHWTEESRAVID